MADALVQEANTQLVNEFSSLFFQDLPTDLRYISTEFHKYSPTNAITEDSDIRFFLPAFTGAAVYILKDCYFEVKVNLQENDAKLADTKVASVVNNTAHTLFKSCSMYLNDEIVNTDFDNYHYKAYIKNVLSYSNSVKQTQICLGADNFFPDGAFMFDDTAANNKGFVQRLKPFAKRTTSTAGVTTINYYGTDVTFIAKLQHDLVTCNTPLLPGVAVRIELARNNHKLLVLSSDDSGKYQLKIKEIFLHVPVALLNTTLFNSIESRLKEKPVLMHYTRTVIAKQEIPHNSTSFTSDNLFLRTQIPAKIIIGFVLVEAVYGKYSKNCFNFARRWGGTALHASHDLHEPNQSSNTEHPFQESEEIQRQEHRLAQLRNELRTISERRASFFPDWFQRRDNVSERQLAQQITDLEESINNLRQSTRQPSSSESAPPQLGAFDDGIFIESTLLTLNGKPIDSLTQMKASARQDAINFMRFHYFMNFNDSLVTNSISEDDFLGGNFFLVYDMSTCARSNQSFMVPSVRLGTLEFTVRFNKPITENVTMIIYQEHPSLITINENRKVSASYSKI